MARRPLRRTTGNGKQTGGVNGGREIHACCQGRKVTPHMPPHPPLLRHEAGELAVELSLSHPEDPRHGRQSNGLAGYPGLSPLASAFLREDGFQPNPRLVTPLAQNKTSISLPSHVYLFMIEYFSTRATYQHLPSSFIAAFLNPVRGVGAIQLAESCSCLCPTSSLSPRRHCAWMHALHRDLLLPRFHSLPS
jgi:hypothetical protein